VTRDNTADALGSFHIRTLHSCAERAAGEHVSTPLVSAYLPLANTSLCKSRKGGDNLVKLER